MPVSFSDAQFVARTRGHWLTLARRARPIPRVAAAARHLAARLPVAVASANDGQVVRAGLAAAGLADLFDLVIAREHVTRLKPKPDAYLLAVTQLAIAPERCLVFENTDDGITAALTVGMSVIDVGEDIWSYTCPGTTPAIPASTQESAAAPSFGLAPHSARSLALSSALGVSRGTTSASAWTRWAYSMLRV
ncbi:HAD family hydrolase [Streptomyces sp. NPDC056399]|uniref:HAD family hydrolase n=1 Tax=Streptomyces sp. NPDC056399 TaxID=3345807 RepID=UPI0035E1A879